MRKIVSDLFISLDGVTEVPHQWQFDVFNDDMLVALTSVIEAEDAIL